MCPYILRRGVFEYAELAEMHKLVASEAEVNSYFGISVTTDGDIMAIGAYGGKGILVVGIYISSTLLMFVTRQGPWWCM